MPFLTADRIVSAALGLLTRESVLARTIWRDPVTDSFTGARNDTVTVRLPAFAPARTRGLRATTARVRDELDERAINLTLDTDIYKDVVIHDAAFNQDIRDFGAQVLAPITQGITLEIAARLAALMSGATYARTISVALASTDMWRLVLLAAREHLNRANVPAGDRWLAVGASFDTALLNQAMFVQAQQAGTATALEEATIGRKAGFNVVSAPELPPNEAYAYHRTAYAMSNKAPAVPAGVDQNAGAVRSQGGFAMRMVRGFDINTVEHRTVFDSWLGTNVVTDEGGFDGADIWLPAERPLGSPLTISAAAAADDIIHTGATAHGFAVDDAVVFRGLTGGAPLVNGRYYWVIAASLTGTAFRVAATRGGAGIDLTSNITAGQVRRFGDAQLVRAVRIIGT